MIRLLLKVLFLRDAESRYQAAKHLYWKLPFSPGFKNWIRDIVVKNTSLLVARSKASTVSLGKRVNLRLEVSGNKSMRQKLTRKSGDDHWVLVANPWIPESDKTSGATRLFAILSLMNMLGCRVVLISMGEEEHHHVDEGGDEVFLSNNKKLLDLCESVIFGREEAGAHIFEYGYRYSHVFLSFPDVAYELMPIVRAYAIHANVIYDTVDLHGLRFRREAELKNDQFLFERADYYDKIEKVCVKCADIVVAITEEEKAKILDMSHGTRVDVIPNIHSISNQAIPFSERHNLLFIGHFLHTPNQDAVIYFVNEILPLIRNKIPDIKFTILGSSVTDNVKRLSSEYVDVVGYVEHPEPYFSSHRVFVSPLRYGAGMKGKVGQSMSLGLPLVTTTIGAEGMELENGKQVLISDSAGDFADSVVRLYKDENLWCHLSIRGLRHIDENYSHSVVLMALQNMLGIAGVDNGGGLHELEK